MSTIKNGQILLSRHSKKFMMLIIEFKKQESLKSVEFKYWSTFLDTVIHVLRDLNYSFLEKD